MNSVLSVITSLVERVFLVFGYQIWIEKTGYNPLVEEFFVCKKRSNEVIINIRTIAIFIYRVDRKWSL